MKKVINITLGGIVFAVEQDAYETLSTYLEAVKRNLNGSDDFLEISEDIETAIAEKFTALKKNEKMAVTIADVGVVAKEMGSPADFGDGAESAGASQKTSTQEEPSGAKKRLYRDTEDSIIAGVASGLARYFDIDPVVVRIIFVVSIFFNGLGVLAYIILWFVVPAAKTTAEKYAMRGDKVTLKEITDRVKKNIENIDKVNIETAKSTWSNLRGLLVKMFDVLGIVVRTLLVIARYVAGIACVLGGALGIAALVSVYSVVLLSDKILFPAEVQIALDTMLGSTLGIVAIFSSFVMMVIPLKIVTIAGASLLAKRNFFTVKKSVSLAVVWIVAVMLAGTTSVLQLEQVMQRVSIFDSADGQYQIHINVDGNNMQLDMGTAVSQEEEVKSAPFTDEVQTLPADE